LTRRWDGSSPLPLPSFPSLPSCRLNLTGRKRPEEEETKMTRTPSPLPFFSLFSFSFSHLIDDSKRGFLRVSAHEDSPFPLFPSLHSPCRAAARRTTYKTNRQEELSLPPPLFSLITPPRFDEDSPLEEATRILLKVSPFPLPPFSSHREDRPLMKITLIPVFPPSPSPLLS